LASAIPLRWLYQVAPERALAEFVAGIRNPPTIACLAVPAVLAPAGLGLDALLRWPWPRLVLTRRAPGDQPRSFLQGELPWLLVIPLLLTLLDVAGFNRHWLTTERLPAEVDPVLAALRTPDLQWVDPPFGEHFYIDRALGQGLKLSPGFQRWDWKDHPPPQPVREAIRARPTQA
jgi:hypothetical protein